MYLFRLGTYFRTNNPVVVFVVRPKKESLNPRGPPNPPLLTLLFPQITQSLQVIT